MMRSLIISSLIFILSACASDSVVLEPAALLDFKAVAEASTIWKINTGLNKKNKVGFFSPHVDETDLYSSGYQGKVKRIDNKSGKEIWEKDLALNLISGVGGDESQIYVSSTEGHLFALKKETGEIVWQQKFSTESLAPPASDMGILVLRTNDGSIIALKAESGEEVWRQNFPTPALTLHGYSSPLIVPGGVLLGLDDGTLVALSLEKGKAIWKTKVSRAEGRSEIERLVDVDGAIVIDNQYIYAVNYQGKLIQVEPQKGNIVWSRDMTSTTGVGVDEKNVYVSEPDGYIWALDKRTGSSMWKMEKLEGRRLTRPVPFTDYLLVGDVEGYLHLLSKVDGSTLGRIRIDNSPIVSAPIIVNGKVFVQSDSGVIRALDIVKLRKESG